MTQPNILLIITDQQRADTLGFVGRTPCRTPHIDRLAAEGVSFGRAMTTSPLCAPARASIFTGQYPHQVNMMQNDKQLHALPVLTDLLRARGYHSACAGKWHLDAQVPAYLDEAAQREYEADLGQPALPKWFDRYAGQDQADYADWCQRHGLPDGRPFADDRLRSHRKPAMSIPKTAVLELTPDQTIDGWITDHAIRFYRERPQDRPFFLVCSYQGPHPPFKIPEPYYSMYDPQEIPEPRNFEPAPNKPRANTTSFYHQLWLDHGADWEAWQKTVAVYWGYVSLLDDQIGRLLACLEEDQVLDDTVVIFISDHGEMLGQHGLWHKMEPYEEAVRVPFIVRYPREVAPGVRSLAGASLIDIVPTMLSLIGLEPPENVAGVDLSPALTGDVSYAIGRVLFAEHQALGDWHRSVDWRMATDNHHKYVWNQGDLDELYDLVSDPYEVSNLINDLAVQSVLLDFRTRLRRWMQETSDPLLPSFEAEADTEAR